MKTQRTVPLVAVLCSAAAVMFAPAVGFAELYQLGIPFSNGGSVPPAGPGPWLSATAIGDGSGGIYLTMNSLLAGNTEFVSEWSWNLDPALDPTQLAIVHSAGPYPALATVLKNADAYQANGDGFFDILFDFPNAPPGDRFNDGDSVTYRLTYPGKNLIDDPLNPNGGISDCPTAPGPLHQCIDYFSLQDGGEGTYITAAHVQGTGGGGFSDWIGNAQKVPEPASLALLMLVLPLLGRTRSRR